LRVAGYGLRVAGSSIWDSSDLGFRIWDLKDGVSELRVAGYGLRVKAEKIPSTKKQISNGSTGSPP